MTRAFGALSTADTPPVTAPRVFARVDTFTLDEAARLGASLSQSAASDAPDAVSERLRSKVSQMQERRKLARSIGLKKATALGSASSAAAGSPRRLDTSKLKRYAAVRNIRKPATVANGAATAQEPKTLDKPPQTADKIVADTAAAQAPGSINLATTEGCPAGAALLELAAEVAAAEGSQLTSPPRKPKWEVVDVQIGGVVEAARNAQKERLSSLTNRSSAQSTPVYSGSGIATRGALTCNGVAMVSSSAGAKFEKETPADATVATDGGGDATASVGGKQGGDKETRDLEETDGDDWEYDYYAVVNPGTANSTTTNELELGWMGAVERDATGGAVCPDSQVADPVRTLPIAPPCCFMIHMPFEYSHM